MASTSKAVNRPISPLQLLLVSTRIWLSFFDFADLFKHNQELSSPPTSFAHLQEGIYLFNNDIDPYSGGSFRHSPLLLSLFATILPNSKTATSLLWAIIDIIGAYALVQIFLARQNVLSHSRDTVVAALYLLNPYIFLPSLALSSSSIENTLMLVAIMFACRKKTSASIFVLSCLTHLSLSSIVMLLPILLLLIGSPVSSLASPKAIQSNIKRLIPLFGEFLIYFATLTLASTLICGNWGWVSQTWGATITLPDLTPTTGLWWYFFTEMFDHFRPFFLMVFNMHLIIYVVPICLKFQYDPLYASFILLGVLSLFKSYPTLSDPGLFLSMISVFPETHPYLRYPIVTALLHIHASLLMPLFDNLWLTQGTGNANFFYASTLVFACANGAAVVDCLWAGLRIAIAPPTVDGYAIEQE